MIYVTADLHGNFKGFINLLQKIDFKDQDILYVLGDVVDRGPKPIELLMDMSFHANIVPILGNHDYIAFTILSQLRDIEPEEQPKDCLDAVGLKLLEWWMDNGGQITLDSFLAADEDMREGILDYLEEFTLYEEVQAGGTSYVLVHAGIKNFKPEQPMEKYGINDLLFEKPDYSKVYFDNKVLVSGHTPTAWIEGCEPGKVYRGNNHLAIDLSADKKIAAVRLDDGVAYYVD